MQPEFTENGKEIERKGKFVSVLVQIGLLDIVFRWILSLLLWEWQVMFL